MILFIIIGLVKTEVCSLLDCLFALRRSWVLRNIENALRTMTFLRAIDCEHWIEAIFSFIRCTPFYFAFTALNDEMWAIPSASGNRHGANAKFNSNFEQIQIRFINSIWKRKRRDEGVDLNQRPSTYVFVASFFQSLHRVHCPDTTSQTEHVHTAQWRTMALSFAENLLICQNCVEIGVA